MPLKADRASCETTGYVQHAEQMLDTALFPMLSPRVLSLTVIKKELTQQTRF